jgi:hypothetical protein
VTGLARKGGTKVRLRRLPSGSFPL